MNGKASGRTGADQAFQAVVETLATSSGVRLAHMFGSKGLKIGGSMFVMRYCDSLVAKLPSARVDELVAAKIGVKFNPGGRRIMREWIEIDGHYSRWCEIAREALAFVRSK